MQEVSKLFQTKHTGNGFDEFSRSLEASVSVGGSVLGFKASVSTHYKFSSIQSSDYSFSRLSSVVERAHLRVTATTPKMLRTLVIPSVASYLNNASPQDIFRLYGTHVTTGLIVGGILELWSSAKTRKFSSETEFKLSAEASFKKFIQGSGSLTQQESVKASKMEAVEGLLASGGSFQTGSNAEDDWALSVNSDAQEIQYLPNGAIPIWNLIPNSAQASRVRLYFEQVFGKRSIILKQFSSPGDTQRPRVPWPDAQIYVPRGWKVLSGGATVRFFGVGQMLTKSYPIIENSIPVGWKVQSKDHLQSDPGQIQAHAIAMWDPYDDWEVKVVSRTSGSAQHPATTASLSSGYALVGGGADARWTHPGSLLVDNYPSSRSLWTASSKDHLEAVSSTVVSDAIGLRSVQGGTISPRIKNLSYGPVNHPSGHVYGTSDSPIIGGGARVHKRGVGNMLVNCYPGEQGSYFFASGKDHIQPDPRVITVYGIELFGAHYVNRIEDVLDIDPAAF